MPPTAPEDGQHPFSMPRIPLCDNGNPRLVHF